jgi:hypothetical protein
MRVLVTGVRSVLPANKSRVRWPVKERQNMSVLIYLVLTVAVFATLGLTLKLGS